MTHEDCGGQMLQTNSKRKGEYKRYVCRKCGVGVSIGRKSVRGRPRKDASVPSQDNATAK